MKTPTFLLVGADWLQADYLDYLCFKRTEQMYRFSIVLHKIVIEPNKIPSNEDAKYERRENATEVER